MFQEFKKRWEALAFLVVVAATLLAAGPWIDDRLSTLENTANDVVEMKESIQILEERVRFECIQVAGFQMKDFDSLFKMVNQRRDELSKLRDNYFDMEKDSKNDPVFVALKEMEVSWRTIDEFLRGERERYNQIYADCFGARIVATSPGGG